MLLLLLIVVREFNICPDNGHIANHLTGHRVTTPQPLLVNGIGRPPWDTRIECDSVEGQEVVHCGR